MADFYVSISKERKNIFRKILSGIQENIYPDVMQNISNCVPYSPETKLGEDEFFYINDFSKQKYAHKFCSQKLISVDYEILDKNEFEKINYLIINENDNLFFQKISRRKLISKKSIWALGENFEFKINRKEIVINDNPDAIFQKEEDKLYFTKLENITSIFKGIDQIYKEATLEETQAFLKSSFIELKNGYSAKEVKKANRKRIALALGALEKFDDMQKDDLLDYVGDYCPKLKTDSGKFLIENESDLKFLLYGLNQRFFTTPIDNKKLLANSIINL